MGRQWNQIISSLGPLSGGTMSINANLTEIEALLTTLQADVADGIVVSSGSSVITGGTLGQLTGGTVSVTNTTRTVTQGTATNLKTQAEIYQGGSAVGSGNPIQVTLANTGSNATAVKVDGSAVTQPVTNRGATGEATVSNFTSTTSATLKSSNPNRKFLTIYNEGAGNLHILYGSGTTSTTNYSVKLFTGDYLEIDKYTGQVNAIFATAGTARVTEIT